MGVRQQTVILVDHNDFKVGYENRERCHTIHDDGLGYHHRGLAVLIYNSKGEVLLQHRKHAGFDGVWDFTGSTHPLVVDGVEESYEQAAERCLIDEWEGLENVELEVTSVFINYSAMDPSNSGYCENEFCRLLVGLYDGVVQHKPESGYGHKWMKFASLVADSEGNPGKYAPWVLGLIREIESKQPEDLPFLMAK